MAIKVATLIAEVTARTTDFDRKMSNVDGTMGRTKTKFASLASSALVAGTAAIGLGTAFLAAAKKASDYADVIDKTAVRTGISRQRLQELHFVASQLGVPFEAIEKAIQQLQRRIPEFEKGTSDIARQFKTLGVEIKGTDGKLRSTSDIFDDTVGALQSMTNETERGSIALNLFGRGGGALLPILNASSGTVKGLSDRAHDLGLVLKDDAVAGLVTFKDKMDEVKKAMDAGLNKAIADNIDLINNEFIPALQTGIPVAFSVIASGIGGLSNLFADLHKMLSTTSTQMERLQGFANIFLGFRAFDIAQPGFVPPTSMALSSHTPFSAPSATDPGAAMPWKYQPSPFSISKFDQPSRIGQVGSEEDRNVPGLENMVQLAQHAGFAGMKLREVGEVGEVTTNTLAPFSTETLIASVAVRTLKNAAGDAIVGFGYAAASAIRFGEGMGDALAHILGQTQGLFISKILKFTPLAPFADQIGTAAGEILGAVYAGRRSTPATPTFSAGSTQPPRANIGISQVQFVMTDHNRRLTQF